MSSDKIDRLIEDGYTALDAGDLDAAADLARRLRADAPRAPEGFAIQAEVHRARDEADQALELIEEGIGQCDGAALLHGAHASVLLDVFDDPHGAREDLQRALSGDADEVLTADLLIMLAEVCLELQDPVGAARAAEEAAAILPDAAEPQLFAALALFDLHRFDEALRACARAVDREPRLAAAYFARGEILAAQGEEAAAARAFDRARQLDQDAYPTPPALSEQAFERIVADAIDALPAVVADYLHNVAVVVEELPDLEALRQSDPPLSPACYGLFEGTPRPRESTGDPWSTLPRAVRLYRRNIERRCATEDEVREVVATTLLHEIGHFLDLDEDDLIERGLR